MSRQRRQKARLDPIAAAYRCCYRCYRRPYRLTGRRTQDRKFICSELVDECYRAGGVKFVRRNNHIRPDDIWRDTGGDEDRAHSLN